MLGAMARVSLARGKPFEGVTCRSLFGGAWVKRFRERRAKRTKKLKADLDKSYLSELQEFKRNQGKRFHAGDALLPQDVAVQFPSMSGCALSGVTVRLPCPRTSLVLVSMKGLGMRMCEQYRRPVQAAFPNRVSVIELSLMERGVLTMFSGFITRNLKKAIPPSRHGGFIFYSGAVATELREALGIHSSIVGHAYLLDSRGLIRWKAHATPTQNELEGMIKCTRELLSCDSTNNNK